MQTYMLLKLNLQPFELVRQKRKKFGLTITKINRQ
jgi:hypothetical protein